MAISMKPVDVIQKVQVLPGQSLASSPVVRPAGRRRRRSGAGWNESTGSVSSRESCLKVVVPKGISSRGCLILGCEPRTVSSHWNAVSAYADMVRHGGGHRGRRPGHADKGITRELPRASSVSCLQNRGSIRRKHLRGSPPRDQSSQPERPVAPSGRSCYLNAETTGTGGQAGWRRNPGWTLGILSNP